MRGQQHVLQLPGGLEILLHRLFTALEFFVQTGVFDGDGDLWSDQFQGADVVFRKRADVTAFEIHHADDAVLHNQRDRDFAANARVRLDVARIAEGIARQHRLARTGGGAGDALVHG